MKYTELEQKYRETTQEQFAEYMNAVSKAMNEKKLSLLIVLNQLDKIINTDIDECRRIGGKGSEMDKNEKQILIKSAKLAAYTLILRCQSRSFKEARRLSLLFLEYCSYISCNKFNLIQLAINCGSYAMTDPGYTESIIEHAISADAIVYKMLEEVQFDKDNKLGKITIDGAGSVSLEDGRLHISSTQSWNHDTVAFSSYNGAIEVCTRDVRDERLKASETDKVSAIDSFASTFMLVQKETKKKSKPRSAKRGLSINGRYKIVLQAQKADEAGFDYLECSPLGTTYEGPCEVKDEELTKGIYTHELAEYLYEQDVIEGAELCDMEEPPLFSIRESYKEYCKKLANYDTISRRVYEAKVIDIFTGTTPDKDRVRLISDKGYAGLMRVDGEYRKGDIIIVYTSSVYDKGDSLFINMEKPSFEYEGEPARFDEGSILDDFTLPLSSAEADMERISKCEDPRFSADCATVRQLATILALSHENNSIERFRNLISAAFMMNAAGSDEKRDELLSRAEFLGQCLRVAEGKPVTGTASHKLTYKENWIVNALTFLDNAEDTAGIASLINDASDDEENKIARLLLLNSLAHTNPDDVKRTPEDIRRDICDTLKVGDHFSGKEIKGGGKYGKGELADVEFKASYVMSNRDGKPDLYRQGRGQVFEAVCGFMNKDGGTVYIGVNNYGDPITAEGYGINADLEWFRNNYSTVLMQRKRQLGHPVLQPKDLDSYCLFLNDEVELYFKPSVRSCITISPTDDMDAIRIDVKPSEFEIVKLYEDNTWTNGTAYVRNGEETLPMSRHDQEQRLMKLRSVGKVEQFILTLTEAIDKKHKVILKGYSSSNSNEVKDRYVVPINLVYNNENLWAYDIEKNKLKEFRLSRISAIETDIPDPEYPHPFEKGEADIFRWINPKINYHIKLEMSIAALNSLREEYSNTKNLPETELYQISPERWVLDTTLHGLGAVRRFYLGLADQIKILDTEDAHLLRKEVKRFIDENLRH